MKKLALLLGLAATLAMAQTAHPARPTAAAAKSSCVPALQEQMQLDTINGLQQKASSYQQGILEGTITGAGGMLLLVGVVAEIRKKKQPTSNQQGLSRAASA